MTKLTYIEIINKQYTDNLGGYDQDDRWSRDSTSTSNDISGFRIADSKSSYDVAVDFEIDPSKEYYLVWAQYGTGDSFGHDYGQCEYVALYESSDLANEAAQYLKECKDWTATIKLTETKTVSFHIPWLGYFETLDFIEVLPIRCASSARRY